MTCRKSLAATAFAIIAVASSASTKVPRVASLEETAHRLGPSWRIAPDDSWLAKYPAVETDPRFAAKLQAYCEKHIKLMARGGNKFQQGYNTIAPGNWGSFAQAPISPVTAWGANNEFAIKRLTEEWRGEMIKDAGQTPDLLRFSFQATASLGQYDFAKSEFPIRIINSLSMDPSGHVTRHVEFRSGPFARAKHLLLKAQAEDLAHYRMTGNLRATFSPEQEKDLEFIFLQSRPDTKWPVRLIFNGSHVFRTSLKMDEARAERYAEDNRDMSLVPVRIYGTLYPQTVFWDGSELVGAHLVVERIDVHGDFMTQRYLAGFIEGARFEATDLSRYKTGVPAR